MNILLKLSFFFVFIIGCSQHDSASSNIEVALDAVKRGRALFLDVREVEELDEQGMIMGAMWVATSKFNNQEALAVNEVKNMAKGKVIYVYCRSGGRAGKITTILNNNGVKAYNIGGFKELSSHQLPTGKHSAK